MVVVRDTRRRLFHAGCLSIQGWAFSCFFLQNLLLGSFSPTPRASSERTPERGAPWERRRRRGWGLGREHSQPLSPAYRSPRRAAFACTAEDTCSGGTGEASRLPRRGSRSAPVPCSSGLPQALGRSCGIPSRTAGLPAGACQVGQLGRPTLTTTVSGPSPPPSPAFTALDRNLRLASLLGPYPVLPWERNRS